MNYDLVMIGPACRDKNTDYTGTAVIETGGAVFFGIAAAAAAGAKVCAALKMCPDDADMLSSFALPKEDILLLPSARTTLMTNAYFSPDRERRNSACLARSEMITPKQLPAVSGKLYHLGGLLYGDFSNELIEALSCRGMLSADMQGFLRHREDNGNMVFRDWEYKKKYLPCFRFLKTDAAEAEILTGSSDRREAAKLLFGMGAKEIFISHNSEMLVYDGSSFFTCPIKARNLSGRTGRGDTAFGAYIAKRILENSIEESLLFATAAVSLKMESPGPLRADAADIRKYIQDFYC